MVDALVASAEEAEPVGRRELLGDALREPAAARTEEEQRPRRVGRLDGGEHRLGADHHARSPAERVVVDRAVDVGRVLAQVVEAQVEQPRCRGLAEQAAASRTRRRAPGRC